MICKYDFFKRGKLKKMYIIDVFYWSCKKMEKKIHVCFYTKIIVFGFWLDYCQKISDSRLGDFFFFNE